MVFGINVGVGFIIGFATVFGVTFGIADVIMIGIVVIISVVIGTVIVTALAAAAMTAAVAGTSVPRNYWIEARGKEEGVAGAVRQSAWQLVTHRRQISSGSHFRGALDFFLIDS